MRFQIAALVLFSTLVACHSVPSQQSALPPQSDLGNARTATANDAGVATRGQACEKRVNDTLAKVEQCIRQATLWEHLSQFQRIAEQNPGPLGHGNRDTGTPGYKASVAYVAKLMRAAGYKVTIQQYDYKKVELAGTPGFRTQSRTYALDRDFFVARLSGSGTVTAPIVVPAGSAAGCLPSDFAGFKPGNVALLERGACDFDTQAANAQAAGARAVVLYDASPERGAYEARLVDRPGIPVVGVASYAVGAELLQQYRSGTAPVAHIDVRTESRSDIDYNVIADSPFGDPRHVVVVDAHLDAIYGAGMLDNASGSTSILDVGLTMARTHTRNQLRYVWFGGEEIGLLGSRYYTKHLTPAELQRIVFDVDADVTATPNYDILIADPRFASRAKKFPPNVIPESKVGNAYFASFFKTGGIAARSALFGNDGTDSLSFSIAGVPNTGILTQQDCCKKTWETKLWGGFRGNYEGDIPSFNGGCVDRPHRWCDNLSNNDPFVFELASKAVAYVTFELANRQFRR